MPIYDYLCPNCGARAEIFKKFSNAEEPVECPECKTPMAKTVSSSNFVLKGPGWYKDGYQGGN